MRSSWRRRCLASSAPGFEQESPCPTPPGSSNASSRERFVDELRRGKYDLTVLGSLGLGAVGSLVLGTVAQHVLHKSPVPVLVVREPTRLGTRCQEWRVPGRA
ncbi:MAG: universal stress protein [Acidimicrobiales bacterium]